MSAGHRPVLLREVLQALAVREGGVYVDATFGRGGHAAAVLERLGPRGRLLAIDRDPEAARTAASWAARDPRIAWRQESFAMLERIAEEEGVAGAVAGILLDLGVSSPQLEDPARGFSFRREGPLDMRMDPGRGESAAAWLARAPEAEIARVLRRYGEEPAAGRIARAIARARERAPLATTWELARVVEEAVGSGARGRRVRHHPATRTFQAIRIHINRELEALEAVLPQAVRILAPGGRLVVISFHSLEDRLVKRFLREEARGRVPPGVPLPAERIRPRLRLVGRAVRASAAEVAANPRARSAVLRAAERTAA